MTVNATVVKFLVTMGMCNSQFGMLSHTEGTPYQVFGGNPSGQDCGSYSEENIHTWS